MHVQRVHDDWSYLVLIQPDAEDAAAVLGLLDQLQVFGIIWVEGHSTPTIPSLAFMKTSQKAASGVDASAPKKGQWISWRSGFCLSTNDIMHLQRFGFSRETPNSQCQPRCISNCLRSNAASGSFSGTWSTRKPCMERASQSSICGIFEICIIPGSAWRLVRNSENIPRKRLPELLQCLLT